MLFTVLTSASALAQQTHLLPDVPVGAQSVSLFGEPLSMPVPK
jgi:hypothetical protein